MATPHHTTSGDLTTANHNTIPNVAGASKYKEMRGRIAYNGSAWAIVTGQFYSTDLPTPTWDTDHLVISTTGFTRIPTAVASPALEGAYVPHLEYLNNGGTFEVHVYFLGYDGVTVTTEDTSMDFTISIGGD